MHNRLRNSLIFLFHHITNIMKKRVSIYDIAQHLGVSTSSVSRGLSDHHSISSALKERIREAARELNYIPSSLALNLKTGKTNTLGVIVPNINRNFFSSAIEGIEDYAQSKGYDVLICQSKDSVRIEERVINSLQMGKVDGVIASVAADEGNHEYYNTLINNGLPVVLFDRSTPDVNASTVLVDDYRGATEAVRHLLNQGYRRIYHIAGYAHTNIWAERRRGYIDAMTMAGIIPEPDWVLEGRTTEEYGQQAAKQILRSDLPRPEAIFCAGDYAALGAMLELQKNGVRIPDDIAFVGFANEPFCELLPVPLSSVEQSSYRMGYTAARMLLEKIDGKPIENIMLEPELKIRASSIRRC